MYITKRKKGVWKKNQFTVHEMRRMKVEHLPLASWYVVHKNKIYLYRNVRQRSQEQGKDVTSAMKWRVKHRRKIELLTLNISAVEIKTEYCGEVNNSYTRFKNVVHTSVTIQLRRNVVVCKIYVGSGILELKPPYDNSLSR